MSNVLSWLFSLSPPSLEFLLRSAVEAASYDYIYNNILYTCSIT